MPTQISGITHTLQQTIDVLSQPVDGSAAMLDCDFRLPSVDAMKSIISLIREIVFPGYFDSTYVDHRMQHYAIGVSVDRLFTVLVNQISRGFITEECIEHESAQAEKRAQEIALNFIRRLPELRRVLYTDVQAIFHNDPAVSNSSEIIFCYPVVQAMIHYRVAHELFTMGVPVIPRILTELAHSLTGIDIHPGATIGEYFSIDHGTGVVIGETCIIGNHVTLYQGVTLGAKSFTLDDDGHPLNLPRHPIIEDHVTIYSNASVLGRITVGHHSVIGGNVWLTESVRPHSRILQRKASSTLSTDGAGI